MRVAPSRSDAAETKPVTVWGNLEEPKRCEAKRRLMARLTDGSKSASRSFSDLGDLSVFIDATYWYFLKARANGVLLR